MIPLRLLLRSFLLLAGWLCLPLAAYAQQTFPGLPAFTTTPSAGGGQTYTLSIQAMLMMTALGFIPAALLMMSSFTRVIIVLSLLRQAMGTMQTPPNQILLGMALFLTFFIMNPVLERVYNEAYKPLSEQKISFEQALDRGSEPLKTFMLRQTRQEDLALFVKLSNTPPLKGPEEVSMRVLIPAYVTSELKTAFQIGFMVFIPFLIIDLVVAIVLMAMGMMMVSPMMISLPFKIMLFVLVDGWDLLLASLVKSFYI